jgi:hypothetical protein
VKGAGRAPVVPCTTVMAFSPTAGPGVGTFFSSTKTGIGRAHPDQMSQLARTAEKQRSRQKGTRWACKQKV